MGFWEEAARDTLLFWREAATHRLRPFSGIAGPPLVAELPGRIGPREAGATTSEDGGPISRVSSGFETRRLAAAARGTRLLTSSPLDR